MKPISIDFNLRSWTEKISRNTAIAAAAAAALLLALLFALRPAPIQVDVAAITRGPLRVTVDEEGKTRIKNIFAVSAPVTGMLRRSALDPGDDVVKDQTVVAVIEPAAPIFLDARTLKEAEAQLAAAQAAVTLAEAEVKQAETEANWASSELTRAEALSRSSTIAERTLERARLDLDRQRAGLARAKANLEVRKSDLATAQARLIGPERSQGQPSVDQKKCCVEVRAPVSGKILRELQESEKVVLAGAPLFEIGNPAELDIVIELLSADAVRIVPGAEASIDSAGLSEPVRAKVRRIEPAGMTKVSALGIEEQRVRVYLDLESPFDVWKRLGHDYRIFARIALWSAPDAVRVPLSALFRRGDRWAVYRFDAGRAVLTTVEIGHRNAEFAEVLSGLKAEDVVVLYPGDRVSPGIRLAKRSSNSM